MSNTQLLINQVQDVLTRGSLSTACKQRVETSCSWLINSCVLLISDFCNCSELHWSKPNSTNKHTATMSDTRQAPKDLKLTHRRPFPTHSTQHMHSSRHNLPHLTTYIKRSTSGHSQIETECQKYVRRSHPVHKHTHHNPLPPLPLQVYMIVFLLFLAPSMEMTSAITVGTSLLHTCGHTTSHYTYM